MLHRASANVLLKSVILLMSSIVVLVLAAGAMDAWRRQETASRLSDVAEVSRDLFRSLANLRLGRALIPRALAFDGVVDAAQLKQIEDTRTAGHPALQNVARLLPDVVFAGREATTREFRELAQRYVALDKEAAADVQKPKAQRRADLGKELAATATALIDVIEKAGRAIDTAARGRDAFIDQMMIMKDAAWRVRVDGGEISVMISNALAAKKHLSPEPATTLQRNIGRALSGFDMMGDIAIGLPAGSPVIAAIAAAKAGFFAPEFVAKRDRMIAALTATDQPVAIPVGEWTLDSVPRLLLLTKVAETALDAAGSHADAQVAAAKTNLVVSLALLIGALALAAGGILMVGRRVIRPLQGIRSAMVKVADGDLATEVPYRDRTDEIGSLAAALATFKENAIEKARIEAEQQKRREQAALRQQAIEHAIAEFEAGIGEALQALGSAAGEMRRTSETLTATAEQTNGQARDAAASSDEASQNVQTVAAASEELSSSIHEISRQVTHAATVAKRAVAETQETDATVQGLTDAAHRIGEIVNLITAIADQTNLLALNATIEAARAGEAGKGFAVVASEVKHLAGQTAKATEDISGQVGAIREVADQALAAMRRIVTTIGEVSSVASSIAAAVEEQGAATAEITRNTQEAARRTQSLSDNIAGVRSCAGETGTAAGGVRSSAETLTVQSDTLRARVDQFLTKIRAA
ncbi:HAMP domain-containing methyl-accepting chemotaxis protein [Rhodoplanes sp. TEM]|uniref:HAMP domain-containing methyl-accepting chemotaxis protein n=1 Tax=Rhodoplanes tepidamans TaxID=200616 RepID=A0ABT5JGF8_RHOTP|nr:MULTISPECIES: HAMP domain-containing methyl-accepting chemotaxis protein [Rhodoplanes]MDC7788696.1 HAMP domain-containing methyl-accepting chemotaxis protein [Rhodoplanes tepidamans]MDC7987622.1 HAMP domain-containing methyl-accepting chemotaxis protein [Rhodoplanes sp. TEM]MDQ0358300.1 methyl-accepting chemotaxis protein [Rhodoplanes tepidamans]